MMSTPAPRNSACAAAISGSLDGSASSAADQRVGCSLLGATSSGPGGRVNPQEGRSEDNGWQKKEGARSSLRSDNEERANKRCQADVGTRVLAARSRWVKLVGREGPFSAFHTNVQPGEFRGCAALQGGLSATTSENVPDAPSSSPARRSERPPSSRSTSHRQDASAVRVLLDIDTQVGF